MKRKVLISGIFCVFTRRLYFYLITFVWLEEYYFFPIICILKS